VLYYRVAKTGGGRMPRLGSDLVDVRGIDLIHDWIASLAAQGEGPARTDDPAIGAAVEVLRRGARSEPAARAGAIGKLTGSTRGGLALMRLIDQGALDETARREALAAARGLPGAEVRDLFERFIPESERVRRLGESINPNDILFLKGDPARGERLFASDATQCRNCHRAGPGVGDSDLGPDLAAIGSKYDRPTLLRHLVEPSLAVEQKYVNYLLETKSGQVYSGVLVSRTDKEVALKDARNETVRVATPDVEQLAPQAKSLMPDSLLRDLTAQQAADLLEFLATRKGPAR
jgi:putative heme-binding domain-containing protein